MRGQQARSLTTLSSSLSRRLGRAGLRPRSATDSGLSTATTRPVGVALAGRSPPLQPPRCRSSAPSSPCRAVRAAPGKAIRPRTVWRILAAAASKPWRYKYGSLPRDPHLAEQAGRGLDWYAGHWQGTPLGPKDYTIRAEAKTRSQARRRCPPRLPPAPGRVRRSEPEDDRGGAWP